MSEEFTDRQRVGALNDFSKIFYSPDTGIFVWAIDGNGITKGKLAGGIDVEGYLQITINRKSYRAHRLAWFLENGVWPQGEIDHIDGDRANNKIENLRVVSRQGNSQNRHKAMKTKTSCSMLGVYFSKKTKKWYSQIWADKVRYCLGTFDSALAAQEAYLDAKQRLHISR